MLSVRKLAALAGVSIATVSRAMRDDPCVRPETRRRILALAEEFHYNPNRLTQGLLSGKSRTIGFVVPDLYNSSYVEMLSGALKEAYQHDQQVIVAEGHTSAAQLSARFSQLVEQRVDGIVVRPAFNDEIPRASLLEAGSYGVITVGIDLYKVTTPLNHVHSDEDQLASLVVDYLVSLGHRVMAFVGQMAHHRVFGRGLAVYNALQQRGLPTHLFVDSPPRAVEPAYARHVLRQLMTNANPPTAIIGWDDLVACRLVQQAALCQLRVPHDVSIIGAGNMMLAEYTVPTVTSVEQFAAERGQAAVRLILEHLEDHAHPLETVSIPCQIVERESCGPPPQ